MGASMRTPKLTRQDFVYIAEVLRLTHPHADWSAQDQWAYMVREFADWLRATNPHFDCDRFIRACGVL
jgi:hypothetical protein